MQPTQQVLPTQAQVTRLLRALQRTRWRRKVPHLRVPLLLEGVPLVMTDPALGELTIRWSLVDKPGDLVATWTRDEGAHPALVATENGPVMDGLKRVRAIRLDDETWLELSRHGKPRTVINEAIAEYLELHGGQ